MMKSSSFLIALIVWFTSSLAFSAHAQTTWTIGVADDGTYDEPDLTIAHGDTVEWDFPDRRRAVVRLTGDPATPPPCDAFAAFDPSDLNEFTGPMPEAASGIFALGPKDLSLSVVPEPLADERCREQDFPISDGSDILCRDPAVPPHRVLDEVLENAAVSGVFLRYSWSEIEPNPGEYDFASLDTEIDRIVAAGKVYSLAIKAGAQGTPSWLGQVLNLPILQLLDTGGDPDRLQCGDEMLLGDPTDSVYAQRYFQMLRGVADHLKEDGARYRALAYIKAGGANLHSHENRLPKRCEPQCPICNPAVWAANGYTPEGLYEFYDDQFAEIVARFPQKTISYQLIQAGFPKVLDADHYEGCVTPDCEIGIPGGTLQTETILDNGTDAHGITLAVQHNGLGENPAIGIPIYDPTCLTAVFSGPPPHDILACLDHVITYSPCPNEGNHPADPDPDDGMDPGRGDFAPAGSGCPNKWVLYEGARGQVTGFQTNNTQQINTLVQVDRTLDNGWLNSDAVFIELYEELIWLAGRTGGALDPSATEPRTLLEWASMFDRRRRNSDDIFLVPLPDPYPQGAQAHVHAFDNQGSADLTFWYTDPAHCDPSLPDTIGKIVVTP